MAQSVSHHLPSQLKASGYSLNSVIRARSPVKFLPVNGTNGYSPQNKNIEVTLSHKDLFDLSTLQLHFDIDCSLNDLASNVIQSVEIWLGGELLERHEDYNELCQVLTLASTNSSFYENELNLLEGSHKFSNKTARPSGSFIHNFSGCGLTKIHQFLPLYHQNLKIILKLADPSVCCSKTTYSMNNVHVMCDTVDVIESYKDKLNAIIRSEAGLSFPLQTTEIKKRTYTETMVFPMSYTELDSIFALVKKPTSSLVNLNASEVNYFRVNLNGKYLGSDSGGLTNQVQIYNAMRKSLSLVHDTQGSTMLDFDTYQNMTLLGVDCEKIISSHDVFSSGINTKELGYNLSVDVGTSSALPADTKFSLICLYRSLVKMSQNSVTVMK